MLTPTEKFIFNSVLFLIFSMIVIAVTLYLPHHILFLANRAWFYYNGEEGSKTAVKSVIESPTGTVLVEKIKETVARAVVDSTISGVVKEL